ncbi:hypothetical protein M1M94_01495 [Thermodesulfovibrionales bacterium]|nr:hypothetical protein [Thermodesulfovibrionales bacterium]
MNKMEFPGGKDFAFTIVDDTDNATVENVKLVYDHLHKYGLRTTKTVWVYPPQAGNPYIGECLLDEDYLVFIRELQQRGFEIALHNVGSGTFTRSEIIRGMEIFEDKIGHFPQVHINHASNPDNIYWGHKRVSFPLSLVYRAMKRQHFSGEKKDSPFFWGDMHKKYIKYTRNFTFGDINTLRADPWFPYADKKKSKYSNFWFSSSDGADVAKFVDLLSPKNVDRLANEQGVCIVYTHFASGFVKDGVLDKGFASAIEYLASKNGWFVPASDILDHLLEAKGRNYKKLTVFRKAKTELKWFAEKLLRRKVQGFGE